MGLGLPAIAVDGNSVADVYYQGKPLVDRARALEGPAHIEVMTWRWYDHSGFAGAKAGVDAAWGLPYRTDDEVRAWLSRDPIVRMGTFLVERGLFTQAELDALKAKASHNVEFAGFVPHDQLASYYQRAKVYCQLSAYEGLPNALCEAMLCV